MGNNLGTADQAAPLPIIAVPRRAAAVLAAVAVLVACGSGESQLPASTPTVRGESTTASPPTTVARASCQPASSQPASSQPPSGVVRSKHYPYSLTLPVEALAFEPADQPWDGRSPITRDRPILDRVILPDVVLFIVGCVWPGDLESFAQMYVDLQAGLGCSQAKDRRETTVAATPAVAFIQDSCGSGEEFARLAVVHDGFGLIAFRSASPGAIDRLVAGLAGLEWR
jgi:hypothetical protein